mgnify:CR=1 FL=1
MDRLYIGSEADRMTVAAILFKWKYTVRQNSDRRPGGRKIEYFLEFERNPGIGQPEKGGGASEG